MLPALRRIGQCGAEKRRRIMINILKNQNGMSMVGQGGKIMLFTLPSLIAAILVRTSLPQIAALPESISFIKPVGYLLLLLGLILWGTALIQLVTGFSKGKLVTTGAYGVVRNPMYSSATFFILPAVALMTLTWVYFVPSVFMYAGVMIFIGKEEKQLTQAFGKEYEDYKARVDRIVPFEALIKGHPVLTFYAVVFLISWGGTLIVVGPGGIPTTPERTEMLFPIVLLAMLAGPSVAGILLTGLVHGRAGFRELLSRLLRWEVGARWYAVALLATPLLAMATLFALLPTSPVFLPGIIASDDTASLLLIGIAVGLVVGIFEELGWTGFAMRQRYGVLTTGLIVGVLWGAWHFILAFWASGDSSGSLSMPLFLPWVLYNVGLLPVYRVLMVGVYDRTGSLLVAMLMHASLTGGLAMIFMPLAISGVPNLIWYLVLTVALWVVVAAVAMANRGQLSRQALRRRVA
jgi:protein-S-isoprenylcysteine O-methyltransferase Ste14/membrane protease YdiL (CAAX protease family)